MGEKLLAQRLIRLLRDSNGRSSRLALALLDWARDQQDWLWPQLTFAVDAAEMDETPWPAAAQADGGCPADSLSWERLPELASAIDTDEPVPALFECIDAA